LIFSATDTVFERLHKEGKRKKEALERVRKSQNQTEYSLPQSNIVSFNHANEPRSNSKQKSITNPSFNMLTKVSPLTSIDQLYPLSPRVEKDSNGYMMDKYMTESNKAQGNPKNIKNMKKYNSNGAVSP